MNVRYNVYECPKELTAPIDRDILFGSYEQTDYFHCSEANRNVTVTIIPPQDGEGTPQVKCNLRENGTCPFLVSKEH